MFPRLQVDENEVATATMTAPKTGKIVVLVSTSIPLQRNFVPVIAVDPTVHVKYDIQTLLIADASRSL